mgnify:CR=1 FL=1
MDKHSKELRKLKKNINEGIKLLKHDISFVTDLEALALLNHNSTPKKVVVEYLKKGMVTIMDNYLYFSTGTFFTYTEHIGLNEFYNTIERNRKLFKLREIEGFLEYFDLRR